MPSLFNTGSHLAPGHCFDTQSVSPHRLHRNLREAHLGKAPEARIRSEWLPKNEAKVSGEIRNILAVGVKSGCFVLAYQGQGQLKAFMGGEQGRALARRDDAMGSRRSLAKYLPSGTGFRVCAFEVPPILPCTVLVVGETQPSADRVRGPASRPVQEARLTATITGCGAVTRVQSFPPEIGNGTRPRHVGGWGESSSLSASQKHYGEVPRSPKLASAANTVMKTSRFAKQVRASLLLMDCEKRL